MAAPKKSPNKKFIVIGVVVLAVIGVGAYLLMGKGGLPGTSGGSNAFTSIKDALTKSVSLECDYSDATENVSYKAYVKNGAIRMDSTSPNPEQAGSIIMKDKKMWMWNGKEGYVMTIPDVTPAPGTEAALSQSDEIIKDLEAYKDKCKPSIVSDSLFAAPTDVTFSDMSAMQESMQKGSGYSEEDMKKMMEQYGGSDTSTQDMMYEETPSGQ